MKKSFSLVVASVIFLAFGLMTESARARTSWLLCDPAPCTDTVDYAGPGYELINTNTAGIGLKGNATATTGATYGVQGASSSNRGRGVYGIATATTGTTYGVYGQTASTNGNGVYGNATATTGSAWGVYGRSASSSGRGVYGAATSSTGTTYGVYGQSSSTSGNGVYGNATATSGSAWGVYGRSASSSGRGVYGYNSATSGTTYGVYGLAGSSTGYGVYGYNNATTGDAIGVYGGVDSYYAGYGVYGDGGYRSTGVYGASTTTVGVEGYVFDGNAVRGYTDGYYTYAGSFIANNTYNAAVYVDGGSEGGNGLEAYADSGTAGQFAVLSTLSSDNAIYAWTNGTGDAGYFYGDVTVTGSCCAAGRLMTTIDHPLDPANQTLSHAAVTAPELTNIYNGNVLLGEKGEAWVDLPAWFEILNQEFRYQLTPIGAPMPNLYIASEIQGNRFQIAGGEPGQKVSWQVTTIRHDPYAQHNPLVVEAAKAPAEQGHYWQPEAFGLPREQGIGYIAPRRIAYPSVTPQ